MNLKQSKLGRSLILETRNSLGLNTFFDRILERQKMLQKYNKQGRSFKVVVINWRKSYELNSLIWNNC